MDTFEARHMEHGSFSMELFTAVLLCLAVSASPHELYHDNCPTFKPMVDFDWDKFAANVWYATEKFSTRSTCLTYQFLTDGAGHRSVVQVAELPYLTSIGIVHDYKQTGNLTVPNESDPANMMVKFNLNIMGSATFVITTTDYDSYALICTCQEVDLLLTYVHRISCTILQRDPVEDPYITQKLRGELDDKYVHDFTTVDQSNCHHGEDKKVKLDAQAIITPTNGSKELFGDPILQNTLKEHLETVVSSSLEGSRSSLQQINQTFHDTDGATAATGATGH